MKHKTFGKLAFLGVFAVAGCYSYASESINNGNYNTVQATPSFSRITVGDSDQLLVRLVNNANNGAVTSYTVNNANSGIQVHFEPNYRPYQNATADTLVADTGAKAQQEYYIVAVAPGTYTFTLTPTSVNTNVSATVTVVVTPHDLGAALSKHTITSGDTVTITAPPGTVFSQSSVVTVAGATVAILSRAPDSTSITFAIASTPTTAVSAPVSVTLVGLSSSPTTQKSTVLTTDSLTAPALAPPTMVANGAANPGDTVTFTLPSSEKFTSTSVVSFSSGPNPAIVVNQPQLMKVLVGPGDSGSATITNIQLVTAASLGSFTETAAGNIHIAIVPGAPTTVSNASPAIGQTLTVTLGGSLRFLANSQVFIGGTQAGIQSVSADSTTATILPDLTAAGGPSTGLVTYTNVALSFLTSVPLALNGDKSVTVTGTYGGPVDPNGGMISTASTITLPPSGRSSVYADGGTFTPSAACAVAGSADGCRWFKVVLAAKTTIDIDSRWQGQSDNGLYILNSTGTAVVADADALGRAEDGGNEPETKASIVLAAGTYYFGQVWFGTASGYPNDGEQVVPAYFLWKITTH